MAKRENNGWLVRLGFLALLAAVTVQLGCQPGSDEELKFHNIISKTPPALVAAVGIDVCGVCHSRQVGQWLTGQHGTANVFDPLSPLDSVGHPTYAQLYQTDGTPNMNTTGHYCYECHDQLGDGRRLQPGYTGNVDRPVIGCESCHGGGAEHYGVGNIPFPKPDAARCGQCHNQSFDHNTYHPNADNIYEDYTMSGHAISINDHNLAANGKDVKATCSRCHTDEGFRKYVSQVPGTTGHDSIEDFFTGLPDLADASDVTCRTCHDPHEATGENLTRIEATNVNGDTQSSEFNTCTSCHQLVNADGGVLAGTTIIWAGTVGDSEILNGDSFAYHDPMINSHGSYEEVITDNHAALPGDARGNYGAVANPQALYYVKKGDPNACAACHSPHLASAEINRAYAKSGHGDPLAGAWVEDPWPQDRKQTNCKRCHTSTGFKFYANSLRDNTSFDPTMLTGEFAYLNDGATIHNETLYCWACHAVTSGLHKGENSYKGEIRNPGQFLLVPPSSIGSTTYPAGDKRGKLVGSSYYNLAMSGDTVYPDASGSNVCIPCHSGRGSGGNIDNLDQVYPGHTSANVLTNVSAVTSHYLPAAGVLYREIGYEYYPHEGISGDTINPNYSNAAHFEHDKLGTPEVGSTVETIAGTNGPCVSCHLHSAGGVVPRHSFSPLELVGSTEQVVSPVCAACHNGTHAMTMEVIDENEEAFHAALEFLSAALATRNFFAPACKSYSVYDANCDCDPATTLPDCTTATKDWVKGDPGGAAVGKKNMGAAFNLKTLGYYEPGAFAHNRYYAKRLIYDSIDWLDDHTMNNKSVADTLITLAADNPGYLDGDTLVKAQAYLIKNGTRP